MRRSVRRGRCMRPSTVPERVSGLWGAPQVSHCRPVRSPGRRPRGPDTTKPARRGDRAGFAAGRAGGVTAVRRGARRARARPARGAAARRCRPQRGPRMPRPPAPTPPRRRRWSGCAAGRRPTTPRARWRRGRRSPARTASGRGGRYAPSVAMSSSCEPFSTMSPCSITRMRSASRMVERRCAITNEVRPSRNAAMACWSSSSVRVSTDDVASSRISTEGRATNARAIVMSCFSPAETLAASSSSTGVVPLGEGVHELVDARGDGGLDDLFVGGALAPVADVVADGSGEQPRVLQDHAGAGAHVVTTEFGDVLPVEQDAPAVEFVEPHDQVDQRGLARTVGPHDGDRLTGFDAERQVGDQGAIGRIREPHVLELDHSPAVDVRGASAESGSCSSASRRGEHALGRGGARLHDRGHATQLRQRLGELLRVLDEGLHVAEADLPAGHHETAENGDADVGEVSDEHHARHDHAGEELRLEAGLVQLFVLASNFSRASFSRP